MFSISTYVQIIGKITATPIEVVDDVHEHKLLGFHVEIPINLSILSHEALSMYNQNRAYRKGLAGGAYILSCHNSHGSLEFKANTNTPGGLVSMLLTNIPPILLSPGTDHTLIASLISEALQNDKFLPRIIEFVAMVQQLLYGHDPEGFKKFGPAKHALELKWDYEDNP